mmetsp:Transcript_27245/g.70146  ORF Transcript_27245/g.70146 Transcript_27245/m.70146 type:complete len:275 (-) Transcript_27245:4823-5647(-)
MYGRRKHARGCTAPAIKPLHHFLSLTLHFLCFMTAFMQHTCTYQPNLYMICSIALRLSPHQAKLKKSASSIRPSTILLALCMQAKMSLWSRVSAHFRMDVKKKGRAHHPALRTHQKNRRAYSGEVKTHKLPASQKPMPPGIAPIPPMAGAMPGAPMAGCCCMPPMPICCIAACCCIWTCCAYGSTPACWGPGCAMPAMAWGPIMPASIPPYPLPAPMAPTSPPPLLTNDAAALPGVAPWPPAYLTMSKRCLGSSGTHTWPSIWRMAFSANALVS